MDETTLSPIEIRVVGVLIEKSLSQPAYYPMTVNAITAACNQKNNREPETDYSEGQVSDALSSLRRKQWVTQAEPERNARSVKFRHRIEEQTNWNAAQRAVMAELMLRGPQTLAELRSHASRMTHLDSLDYARELLGELERSDPPLVRELEREAGRSARRFAQLLGGDVEVRTVDGPDAAAAGAALHLGSKSASAELAGRIDRLESEVANLRAELNALRSIVNA